MGLVEFRVLEASFPLIMFPLQVPDRRAIDLTIDGQMEKKVADGQVSSEVKGRAALS